VLAGIPLKRTNEDKNKVKKVKLNTNPSTIPNGRDLPIFLPSKLEVRIIGKTGSIQGERIVTNPAKNANTTNNNISLSYYNLDIAQNAEYSGIMKAAGLIALLILIVGAGLVFWKFRPVDTNTKILRDITALRKYCPEMSLCSVDKVAGDYAKGQMPMAYWLAKKINGTWTVVVAGNGIPDCSQIDEFSIPQEIYGNCIEASGGLRHQ
jgi:hypothetical protein